MRKNAKVITVCNQKGGTGKTTVSVNLAIGLVREGKKVLVIDADAQGSLTESLGYSQTDSLEITLATEMEKVISETEFDPMCGILHHEEGVDLLPCNIELSGMEVVLVNAMSRETVLKRYINMVKDMYDYIIVDCTPSLGMITINALVAADSVLIPVQAAYLPVKGLELLVNTIARVKKHINPDIEFEGILISMVDQRTVYAREIIDVVRDTYGDMIPVLETMIPFSVRAAETVAMGKSIYVHAPGHKVTVAFENLTKEVLSHE